MTAIVIVDDDKLILKTMSFVLSEAGYDVHTAITGKEAIDLLENTGAAVIISDVFMPDQDGIEVFMTVMAQFPQVKRIMMSGGGSNSDFRMLTVSNGTLADAIMTKPVSAEILLSTVEKLLDETD